MRRALLLLPVLLACTSCDEPLDHGMLIETVKPAGEACNQEDAYISITFEISDAAPNEWPQTVEMHPGDCGFDGTSPPEVLIYRAENGDAIPQFELRGCKPNEGADDSWFYVYAQALGEEPLKLSSAQWTTYSNVLPNNSPYLEMRGASGITFTQWGEPGEMVSGTFEGHINTEAPNYPSATATIHGEFHVCRSPDVAGFDDAGP